MQLIYRVAITFLAIIIIIPTNLFAQNNLCEKIYIWDFESSVGERNTISKALTDEVEDVLSQIQVCQILQRRNYKKLQQQVENELQILKVEKIPESLIDELKTIQAKYVLFGEVETDFSFNVKLRLSLENLDTKEIKTTSIIILGEDMIEPNKRKKNLENSLFSLINQNVSSTKKNDFIIPIIQISSPKFLHTNSADSTFINDFFINFKSDIPINQIDFIPKEIETAFGAHFFCSKNDSDRVCIKYHMGLELPKKRTYHITLKTSYQTKAFADCFTIIWKGQELTPIEYSYENFEKQVQTANENELIKNQYKTPKPKVHNDSVENVYFEKVKDLVNEYADLVTNYVESERILDQTRFKDKICRLFIEECTTTIYIITQRKEPTKNGFAQSTSRLFDVNQHPKRIKGQEPWLRFEGKVLKLESIIHHKTDEYYEGIFEVQVQYMIKDKIISKKTRLRTYMRIYEGVPHIKIAGWPSLGD